MQGHPGPCPGMSYAHIKKAKSVPAVILFVKFLFFGEIYSYFAFSCRLCRRFWAGGMLAGLRPVGGTPGRFILPETDRETFETK